MSGKGETPKKVPVSTEAASAAPGVILLVDDNCDTVEVTRQALEAYTSFQVLTAQTGPEALAILDSNSVDVIVLDLVMPGMNGDECFGLIRKKALHAPVIFLTGFDSEEKKREQLALGAFDYLAKPIRARDLILLVNDAHRAMQRIKAIKGRSA